VERLIRDRIISSNVVKPRNASLTAQLMNQFTFPEQHHVLLVLGGLLNFSCVHLACLLFLYFKDLSECSRPKLLDDLESTIEDFLALL